MSDEPAPVVSIWINKRQSTSLLRPMTCYGDTHLFDRVPGRCECGRELWEPEMPPPRLRLVD